MKRKFLWLLVAVAAGVGLDYWLRRPPASSIPEAAKATASPQTTAEPVAIQDRKTIDFSSGKPVVKDSPQDRAIIDGAVKEMDEAAKNVSFSPTTPPPAAKPSAASAEPPPKN